ncbi:uncharacterized protein LOC123295366 isoform X2 [Chrysoperla carnea]|uniref:uncharacterized protein LOC123295366 isoform X2 n=1 Tax=Chrysoperla carnea TaxID=189513 RepID=UPI001D0994EC|nr:uncharacterized protein LOC123295366 isoform X2 [Chrysoperla carnea]
MESFRDSNPTDQPEEAGTQVFPSFVSKNTVLECTNVWIYYLQMLNGLCTAGVRLSQCLNNLAQLSGKSLFVASQCQTSWDELLKATLVATQTVKTHIVASLQDISIVDTYSEQDSQQQFDNNQQIISENVLTFINLQYQFSLANCEFFGIMATCPCCQTLSGGVHDPDCGMASLQQCFARLCTQEPRSQTSSPHSGPSHSYHIESTKTDVPRTQSPGSAGANPDIRVPSPFQGQESIRGPSPVHGFVDTIRGPSNFETIRGPFPNPGQLHTMKTMFPGRRGSRSPLNFPLFPLNGQRRWSEAAAAEVMSESSEGTMRRWSMPWDSGKSEQHSWPKILPMSKLTVPISTSSQDRSRSVTPESSCIPSILGSEGLAEAIQLLSSRPLRTTMIPTHLGHPNEERFSRKMYHMQHGHRAPVSLQDPHETGTTPVTQQYEINPPIFPQGYSRKSSSSTDSSSCLSIHSRSTTSSERGSDVTAAMVRTHHIYSIWSGSDYLPFIRVPESQEPQESSDEDESTDGSRQSLYPKPT